MRSLIERLFPPRPPAVREAVAADAGALAQIHARAFRHGWDSAEFERLIAERAVRAHVVGEGPRGAPMGFVLSHVVAPEAEILSVAVRTDRRGRGLGGALLRRHLARLAAEGVTTSFLEVEEGNAAALALYGRLGYVQVGRRKGYYAGGGADALLLRLDF